MKVLSYRQPWAYLVAAGIKPIENRTWRLPEKYKGQRVLIHASKNPKTSIKEFKKLTLHQRWDIYDAIGELEYNKMLLTGAIIGSVEIVDCVQNHPSPWAEKDVWNWVLANPVLFSKPITNIKGKLGFWDYPMTEEEYQKSGKS